MIKYLWLLLILGTVSLTSCSRRVVYTQPAAQTVVVKRAPANSRVVVVRGKRYRYWGGRYYQKTRRGYVVVKL